MNYRNIQGRRAGKRIIFHSSKKGLFFHPIGGYMISERDYKLYQNVTQELKVKKAKNKHSKRNWLMRLYIVVRCFVLKEIV